jgi:hypothetical protein
VFVLEHYFTSKSFAAVREAFSNAYPDKEVPNETTIHPLVPTFRDTGSVCCKCSSREKTAISYVSLVVYLPIPISCKPIRMFPLNLNVLYRTINYMKSNEE